MIDKQNLERNNSKNQNRNLRRFVLGTLGLVGLTIGGIIAERPRGLQEEKIKENATIYSEYKHPFFPSGSDKYWGADMNRDGEVDTIYSFSIRMPARVNLPFVGSKIVKIGDPNFQSTYSRMMESKMEK